MHRRDFIKAAIVVPLATRLPVNPLQKYYEFNWKPHPAQLAFFNRSATEKMVLFAGNYGMSSPRLKELLKVRG